MLIRAILPDWAKDQGLPNVIEDLLDDTEISDLNQKGYNIYFFPNYGLDEVKPSSHVKGPDIKDFQYVFLDMDLKEGKFKTKEEFIQTLTAFPLKCSFIVDSGNGVHAYWAISDLNAKDYLKFQRRLSRDFNTDPNVSKIAQLMRYPGSYNTKTKDLYKLAQIIEQNQVSYTCEQLDKHLKPLTQEDNQYVISHYNHTYDIQEASIIPIASIPLKFMSLLRSNPEVKSLWADTNKDRSKSDFRLGHILYANNFTKDEAISVLMHGAKASERTPVHQRGYASNIVDKIWTEPSTVFAQLSRSVSDILKTNNNLDGTRFSCYPYLDNTEAGFRLGQVIGLVAGSGVGKTTAALNMFLGFVENNPEYIHFFISLEQPEREIAKRWKKMCGTNDRLHDKVHILGNYDDSGAFRHLSLSEIQDYLLGFQKQNNVKIGCVVIDHIGALKKQSKNGENQAIVDICHEMKAFAIQTNTMLIMQSQAPREKAGIGDLELDKDAAYGTVFFESYCDYLITLWQPLKRCYMEAGCPTIMAFKFCKIRHKNQKVDKIKEDVRYKVYFDVDSERLRELTQEEDKSFSFFNNKCVNKRKQDRKSEVLTYESTPKTEVTIKELGSYEQRTKNSNTN